MIEEVLRSDVQQLASRGLLVVEVLPSSEYKEEHLPGAISIPLRHLTRERMAEFARELPVVVYCFDGQ
jgi:rhodanese-related sulfurtransferase